MNLVLTIVLGLMALMSAWGLVAVALGALRVRRTRAVRLGMGIGGPSWLIVVNALLLVHLVVSFVREPGRYPSWGLAVGLLILIGSLAGWLFGTWIDGEGLVLGGLSVPWARVASCRMVPRGNRGGATLLVKDVGPLPGPMKVRLTSKQADRARALLAKHGQGEGLPEG